MKILIVNTNREKSPNTLVPLGACYVASSAKSAGHKTCLLDLCFERDPAWAMEQATKRVKPDVIGLSVRNLDNCDYSNPRSYLPEIRSLVEACRRSSDALVILGGSAVSQAPDAVARYMGSDIAIAGEGERSFPALLAQLESGETSAGTLAAPLIDDLMSLPDPLVSGWVDLRRYAAYGAAMPVQTKRGCAFRCSYCCYPVLEGSEWRLREPEWVAEQVVEARKTGLRSVEFVDSVFGFPQNHAIACCEAVAHAAGDKGNLPLECLELNPAACSPELIGAMNKAGFSAVGVTAESGSETMLDSLNKGFTAEHLQTAAQTLRKLDSRKLWVFMLGGPGETKATVRETAKFIESLPASDLVLATHGVRVLPGTALREQLVSEGVIAPEDDLIQPTFYYSPHVTPQCASRILAECSFPSANMITITDAGHPLAPVVQRVASMFRLKPPYWRHLPTLNRMRKVLRV